MKQISLGFKVPDYSKMEMNAIASSQKERPETPMKEEYPQLTIVGNKTMAKHLKPEQEFTALVTFRVSEVCIRDRKGESENAPVDRYGGTHVDLDAISMQIKEMPQDEEEEESGGDAIDSFFGKE